MGSATIAKWTTSGYLHRVHPGVYAVGHSAPSLEGDLAAALLYAGPGAALSHTTAAYWLSLTDEKPKTIHVSTLRRCRSRRGVRVHPRRNVERIWHKQLTTTTPSQTLLDYAAVASKRNVRRALAEADYSGMLDLEALGALVGRGRPGSAKLLKALDVHQPKLALTRSKLEQTFFALCETHSIPLPEINVKVAGWLVDAYWPEQGLVVELDGYDNHRSPAQIRRDRRKELGLRHVGLMIARYSSEQVETEAAAVAADVLNSLARSDGPGSR